MTTTTIGLVLAGFLIGALLAWLFGRNRSRHLKQELAAQSATAQSEAASRQSELEGLRAEHQTTLAALQSARDEAAEQRAQLSIAEAELQEARASAGEVEDRLNAAEARVLTADALIDQHQADLAQWGQAYGEVRAAHARLNVEHLEILGRYQALEDELHERRLELDELTVKLDALQDSQRLRGSSSAEGLEIERSEIAQARADAEAALRRREMDLAEVQSQLTSMRYSINILTAAGAELARRLVDENVVEYDSAALPNLSSTQLIAIQPPVPVAVDAAVEELAGLRGIIADWFAEMKPHLQFDPAVLLLFGGASDEDQGGAFGVTIDAAIEGVEGDVTSVDGTGAGADAEGFDGGRAKRMRITAKAPMLPPSLMLAAIKAAAMTSLERGRGRGDQLSQELMLSQARYDDLTDEIKAWRTMLNVTLSGDPDVLQLLDERRDASAGELLSACATVALSAYQKKQAALDRMARGLSRPVEAPRQESSTTMTRYSGSGRAGRKLPVRR